VPFHFFFNVDQKPNPSRLGVVVVVVVSFRLFIRSASSSLSQRPRFVFAFSIPFSSKVFESRLSVSAVCCRYRASLSELSFLLPFPSIFSVFRPLLTWSASIPGLGFWSLSSRRIVINVSAHDFSRLCSPVLRFSGISSPSFRFIPFRRLQPNHSCRSDCHIVL
jgi:hypothetical protein